MVPRNQWIPLFVLLVTLSASLVPILSQADAPRINRFARGHPLACKLAAAAALERPELKLQEVASQHVVAELTRLYLADVQDPLTREALDAAAVVRRTTRSLGPRSIPTSCNTPSMGSACSRPS